MPSRPPGFWSRFPDGGSPGISIGRRTEVRPSAPATPGPNSQSALHEAIAAGNCKRSTQAWARACSEDGSAYGGAFHSRLLPPAPARSRQLAHALFDLARTHSCRPSPSDYIPGSQGVAGSNPAVPTGQSLISNAGTVPLGTNGSATRSHPFDETAVGRPVGGHNAPLVSRGRRTHLRRRPHPGALVSRSKGRQFTSGRQGWL